MRLQDTAKGVGLFFLFLLLYTIISAIVALLALYLIDNLIFRKIVYFISNNENIYEHILDIAIAIIAGSSGVPLGIAAYTAIIKKHRHDVLVSLSYYG
jgi:hypothetical protein